MTDKEVEKPDPENAATPQEADQLEEMTADEMAVDLRRPKQVHICTGVVRNINRKIWWVNSTKYPLFLSTIFRSGIGCQKSQFFNKGVQKGCLFTLPHQGLGGLAIQKSFLCENGAIYPHFGLRGLAVYSIEMCKRTPFHQYVVAVQCVHSAAINVNRCISKYAS